MDIIRFKSDPPLTAFAPTWEYVMGEDFLNLTNADLEKIKELIISKETDILENTEISDTDGYTGLGSNSITSRFQSFNILLWPNELCKIIENEILDKYKKFLEILNVKRQPVFIQCWANILRKNESIKPHIHSTDPYTYLGGHICITENDTETCYINPINQLNDPVVHCSKNTPGKITLFQNNIPHYTSINQTDNLRITLAFDIIVKEKLQTYSKERQKNFKEFDYE